MTPPPLLLAAHGTTDQAGVDAFAALTERVGKLAAADGTRVAGGFIELSEPPLREAVTGLAGASPGPMVAVPLMLSAATTRAWRPGCSAIACAASRIRGTPLAQPTPVTWYLSVVGCMP